MTHDITVCIVGALITDSRKEYLDSTLKGIEKYMPGVPVLIGLDKGVDLQNKNRFNLNIKTYVHNRGYGNSINWCIKCTETKYILQIEDDWLLEYSYDINKLLEAARSIINTKGGIVRLCLAGNESEVNTLRLVQGIDSDNPMYEIIRPHKFTKKNNNRYSNNPHLKLKVESLFYTEGLSVPNTELDMCEKFYKSGMRVFTFKDNLFTHIGVCTKRDFDSTKAISVLGVEFLVLNDNNAIHDIAIGFWDQYAATKWEKETLTYYKNTLNSNMVYFDIGTWIGPTVLFASRLVKQCHAFEPDPAAFRELRRNIRINEIDNIVYNNLGIADKRGVAEFGIRGDGVSTNSFIDANLCNRVCIVDTIRLEDYINDLNIEQMDFLKIDIEGSEVVVLPDIQAVLLEFLPIVYLSIHVRSIKHILDAEFKLIESLKIFNRLYTTHDRREISLKYISDSFHEEKVRNYMVICQF